MEEGSDKVLDDLRKKRLAYYGTISTSQDKPGTSDKGSPIFGGHSNDEKPAHHGERILSEDDILESERFLKEKSQEWGHVNKVKASAVGQDNSMAAVTNKFKTVESNPLERVKQEHKDGSASVKTTSFYFTNPDSTLQPEVKPDYTNHRRDFPAPVRHADLPVTGGTVATNVGGNVPEDGYNETVERLIKATKEELLGMNVSDDIWTRFTTQPSSDSGKGMENRRSVSTSEYDFQRESNKTMQNVENVVPENAAERNNMDVHLELDRQQYQRKSEDINRYLQQTGVSETVSQYYDNMPASVLPVGPEDKPAFNKFESSQQKHSEFSPGVAQVNINAEKVEEIFSSRLLSKSQAFPANYQHVQTSADTSKARTHATVHESLDLSELGLSTHRPESDGRVLESSVEAEDLHLGDTVTKELRILLGEEKFQQFLEKSKRDIDDLHSDRSAPREYTPKLVKEKPGLVARSLSTGSSATAPNKEVKLDKRKTSHAETKTDSVKSKCIPSKSISGRSRKTSAGDVKEMNGSTNASISASQEFTPRTPDAEAVNNLLDQYVLVKKDALGKPLTSNPAYKSKRKQDSADANEHSDRIVPELNLADVSKPDSPRPKLNRPKHEPPNIYPERQKSDLKEKVSDRQRNEVIEKPVDGQTKASPSSGKNYEQITVPRNVTFSASEIYQQAYGGFAVGQTGPVPISPHYPSGFVSQAMGLYMAPVSGINTPLTPTTPMSSKSNISQTYMLNQQYSGIHTNMHPMEMPHPGFGHLSTLYPGDAESVAMKQFYTRQSSVTTEGIPVPHPPVHPPPHAMSAPYPQLIGQVPPEFRGCPTGAGPGFPGQVVSASQPLYPQPPMTPISDNQRYQQPISDNQRYQQPVMASMFQNAAGMSVSYPYQYQMMLVPPHPPPQDENRKDSHPSAGEPSRQSQKEISEDVPPTIAPEVPDAELAEAKQEKATIVEESTFTSVSQIVRDDMMIPHPPPTKKEKRPSPRRHPKQPATQQSQDSKRHIDGIRQHHEQRRQQQEETLTDEQILEKQRRFAKASLDRYFSSLENLYKPSHAVKSKAFLSPQESEEKEDEAVEVVKDNENSRVDLAKSEVDIVDDVLNTVCHDFMNKEPDTVKHFESDDTFTKSFYEQSPTEKETTSPEPVINTGMKTSDVDNETAVNTEVTALSVDAGGVTQRLNELGIAVTHEVNEIRDKNVPVGPGKSDKHSHKGKGKEKKGKLLLICPECEGLNKEYMSWCTHCGEMIIGVEPMLVSKNREGKLRVRPVKNKEPDIDNTVNKTQINMNKIQEQSLMTPATVNVNYEQESVEKPFTLNLDGIKSPKKDAESKKSSPIKSDSRDSGRPSSDDRDNEMQTNKIEEEVVNDICETISDPVVKGYVKSHFNKARHSAIDGRSLKEKLQDDMVLSSLREETDTRLLIQSEFKSDKNVADEGISVENKMHNSHSAQPVIDSAQPVINAQGNVQSKIALFSQTGKDNWFDKEHIKPDYPVQLTDENTSKAGLFESTNSEDVLVPPPLPHFSSTLPNAHNEFALKLPANSMDYSTDYSQMGSVNFDKVKTVEDVEEKPVEKTKEQRRQERRNRRGHGAIDVEVFGIDEMRESRNSSRGQRIVPTLNLGGNSSDEDDWSVHSDAKSDSKLEPKAKLVPHHQHNVSMPAWEPEVIPEEPTERDTSRSLSEHLKENGPGAALNMNFDVTDINEELGASGLTMHKGQGSVLEKPGTSMDLSAGIGMPDAESPAITSGYQGQIQTNGVVAESNDGVEDGDDWKHLFDPVTEEQEDDQIPEDHDEMDDVDLDQPFLLQVINNNQSTTGEPVKAKRRPKSGKGKAVKSKVRQSLEETRYQRKWARSSTAWSSYNPGELNTASSLRSSTDQGHVRPASARVAASGSMDTGTQESATESTGNQPARKAVRPASADLYRRKAAKQKSTKKKGNPSDDLELELDLVSDLVEHRLPRPTMLDRLHDNMASPKSTYDKYIQMTPRIQAGTVSRWQCLPDEILLHVFAYLDQSTLTRCAQVCHQFYRVAMDESLWKYITIKKKTDLDDNCLAEIAKRHPVSLALLQCHGDKVTAKGLRDLFRECSNTLKELNVARCSRGALHGDSLLLHAAARCHNLTHIDTSWCTVTDSGLMAISNTCNRIESLCINGCQSVSNDGFETVIKKHGAHLRVLEMFGCFNITPRGLRCIANNCIHLVSLNLGQCYKLTDSCIAQLSTSLGRVETLNLRGCKQIKDNCIRRVVKNCPRLKHLSLANCPSISDVSLLEISTYLTDIRSIDLCGLKNITDNSVRALANTCTNLRSIDISSTGCTQRSVSMIANFCGQRLELLMINFLTDVTEQSLIKLAKHCRKLKSVHLYGCTSVRNLDKVRDERPTFSLEM